MEGEGDRVISVEELFAMIDRQVKPLPEVNLPLRNALGKRLAMDVTADADMPAFTRSAIDGFLLPAAAPPGRYRIVGETLPGQAAGRAVAEGEARRIYTGSALPEDHAGLVMVEDARIDGGDVVTEVAASASMIRKRGSQAQAGTLLWRKGEVVTPGALALLASVGVAHPLVSPVVRCAHLVTGRELIDASGTPEAGFIRDSNSPMIEGLLIEAGAERCFHRHVDESVDSALAALENNDAEVVLLSGGASVGAYDGTREILNRLGFVVHCSRVKSRPGKPLIFATRGTQVAFGLPGNSLSHFVCFHLFVRRALDRLRGLPVREFRRVRIEGDAPAPDPRETWWPAEVALRPDGFVARPLPWTDSSDLTGLPKAGGLLRISAEPRNGLVEALIFGRVGA